MRNLLAVIVWGNRYVSQFLNICLPTLLTPGNLGAVDRTSKFLIVTTREGRVDIERSPVFITLKALIEVEFLIMPMPGRRRDKYKIVSRYQWEAIRESSGFDALFLLYPDFVFVDGTLAAGVRRIAEGYEAVVIPVPRLIEEEIVSELSALVRPGYPSLTLFHHDFMEMATRSLHPTQLSYQWGSKELSSYPSTLLWAAPGGVLLRCFHLHPLVIRVQRDQAAYMARFRISLDEEYIARLFPDISGIYCIADSDEAAVCSLSPRSFGIPRIHQWEKPDTLYLARWAERATATLHRQFVGQTYRWHVSPIDLKQWQVVEDKSRECIEPVLERLALPDSILRIEDPEAYAARHRRIRRFGYWSRSWSLVPLRLRNLTAVNLVAIVMLRALWKFLVKLHLLNAAQVVRDGLILRPFSRSHAGQNKYASHVRLAEGVSSAALLVEAIRRLYHRSRSSTR